MVILQELRDSGDYMHGADAIGLRLLEGDTDETEQILSLVDVGNIGMADMQIRSPNSLYVFGSSSAGGHRYLLAKRRDFQLSGAPFQRHNQGAVARWIQRVDEQASIEIRRRYSQR